MARQRRENPFLVLLIFSVLTAGLVYFLILVWEIPSPAQNDVRCAVSRNIFLGQEASPEALCAPETFR